MDGSNDDIVGMGAVGRREEKSTEPVDVKVIVGMAV